MNETSRISSSREFHGSRPRTFNSPSYEVRPRMALSAVVLPAPLGPMRPRIRPSSTRKSIPSSATVVLKVLRRPRASMDAMGSALLLSGVPGWSAAGGSVQFLLGQTKPLDGGSDPGPFFSKKLLALTLEEQLAGAGLDEHA